MLFYLGHYVIYEKVFRLFGRNRVKFIVNGHAYTFLTSSHAECAGKLYLIFEIIIGYQLLKFAYDRLRAFQMAGASYTNGNFHSMISFPYIRPVSSA